MPEEESFSGAVDLNTETDPTRLAQKISTEIQQSRTYWQEFKTLCTELYFDLLAFKESIRDKTKSNTFIPLSYVDIMVTKGRIKQIITGTKPYGQCKPKPYNADLGFKASQFAHSLLSEAGFESFLDLLVQDALTYTGAPFQVTWGTEYKMMPAFWDAESLSEELGEDLGDVNIRIPKFDPSTGKRVFENQEIRDGIVLENIHIQDFYLPKNAVSVESALWADKIYSATIEELEKVTNPDGSSYYTNLDRLRELGKTLRPDTAEKTRQAQPVKRDYPQPTPEGTYDIHEFCINERIFHWPEGADFLISQPDEENPYKKKPFHIARVEKLTGEPYGFSPNRANHLISRLLNEVADVTMDQLFLEDNKAWVIDDEAIDDFEVGASQGNLIHIKNMETGDNVRNHIYALETRAVATEVIPFWDKIDRIHQLVARRPDMTAGMPVQGVETAYEGAQLAAGASTGILDFTANLADTALRPIYEDLFHLCKIKFAREKSIDILDDNGALINHLVMTPHDVYADYEFEFEFLNKERNRIEERAALTNMLMVWGNVKNVDEVSALLMKNLILQSGISDTAKISEALEKAIYERRVMQQAALMAKMAKASTVGGGQATSATPKKDTGSPGATSRKTANFSNVMKPTGS